MPFFIVTLIVTIMDPLSSIPNFKNEFFIQTAVCLWTKLTTLAVFYTSLLSVCNATQISSWYKLASLECRRVLERLSLIEFWICLAGTLTMFRLRCLIPSKISCVVCTLHRVKRSRRYPHRALYCISVFSTLKKSVCQFPNLLLCDSYEKSHCTCFNLWRTNHILMTRWFVLLFNCLNLSRASSRKHSSPCMWILETILTQQHSRHTAVNSRESIYMHRMELNLPYW